MTNMKTKPVSAGITYDEGLTLISTFAHHLEDSSPSYTWAVLMQEDDGTFSYWERHSNPCYGEMRPYATGSTSNGPYEPELMPVEQRKVHKPSDLYWPFPRTGQPVLLAVPFGNHTNKDWDELITTIVLNPEVSPWRNVLKDFEIVRHPTTNIASGLIIKDTNIEPTAMVNLFRKLKNDISETRWINVKNKYPDLTPVEAFVFAGVFSGGYVVNQEYGSWFGMNYNLKRIITGTPVDQTGGTFFQRYAYNRPKCDFIFNDGENIFPSKLGKSDPWGGGPKVSEKKIFEAFLEDVRA